MSRTTVPVFRNGKGASGSGWSGPLVSQETGANRTTQSHSRAQEDCRAELLSSLAPNRLAASGDGN